LVRAMLNSKTTVVRVRHHMSNDPSHYANPTPSYQ
jgi:hypothetical protein